MPRIEKELPGSYLDRFCFSVPSVAPGFFSAALLVASRRAGTHSRDYLRTAIFLQFAIDFSSVRIQFPVFSSSRTNFAEMPGNRSHPGASKQGRRGGESESLKEEAIGIGNSYRTHPA